MSEFKPIITDSKIGKNCNFGIYSKIRKSVLAGNNQVYKFASVFNSKLEEYTSIGDNSKVIDSNLSKNVRIDRNNYIIGANLGKYSYTGQNTFIFYCTIGKFAAISWGVTIGPGEHNYKNITNHNFIYHEKSPLKPPNEIGYNRFKKEIKIGNDVWIGTNATLLRGIEIGNGAVIGANSLVNKSVPDYAIVAGNPAKIIKYRFSEEIIDRLLTLEWWNFSENLIKENYFIFKNELNEDSISYLEKVKEKSG